MTGRAAGARALLLTGTVGAGKTTTAEAVGELLAGAGVPHAVIDLDWLAKGWPAPDDDPFHLALLLRNLAAVAANHLDAGAVRLVLAGVAESEEERKRYEEAVGVPLTVCRLKVPLPLVRERLVRRHEGDAAGLEWHLRRSSELDGILDAAGAGGCTVEVRDGGPGPTELAAEVVAAVGWG
ncbi:hypothetical protein ACFYVL_43425 [Streptomyces sp. NPDC004111]|uniref:hypothetical protein n=1 Tax=Streptomyces sp. NPDC004111 TaxID=3364690 RepID=UPI0036A65DFB